MALTPKDRERIIEEETLRYETRRNLACGNCSGRPRRWPWVLAGVVLIALLYSHIFCRGGSCAYRHGMLGGHCPMLQQEDGVAPGQPVPAAPAQK